MDAQACLWTWASCFSSLAFPQKVCNQDKKTRALLEESRAGRLGALKDASDEQLVAVLNALNRKRDRDRTYLNEHRKRAQCAQPPQVPILQNRDAYLDAEVSDLANSREFQSLQLRSVPVQETSIDIVIICYNIIGNVFEKHKTQWSSSITVVRFRPSKNRMLGQEASLFIVDNLGNVPLVVNWNAILTGGVVCGPQHIKHGKGPLHTFKRAMDTKRILWMTDSFLNRWPRIAQSTIQRPLVGRSHHNTNLWFNSYCGTWSQPVSQPLSPN